MGEEGEPALSVDEFVDYCRTQAGLLSGRIETMGAAVDDLLDEIDEQVAEARARLEGGTDDLARPAAPQSVASEREVDVADVADLQSGIEEKQALVEAKQARMQAFQELAAGYTDLAEELQSGVDDGREAMQRVVRFEADNDAPAYFEDRKTVVEAAVSDESDAE